MLAVRSVKSLDTGSKKWTLASLTGHDPRIGREACLKSTGGEFSMPGVIGEQGDRLRGIDVHPDRPQRSH